MKTLLLLIAAIAQAQTVDISKPPSTAPLAAYKLPPVTETTLANGLGIVLVEDRRFPIVTLRLNFPAGSKYDPAGIPGLAETVASLLKEGTKTRTARQIADEMTAIGGAINGIAGPDSLVVAATALSEFTPDLLAIAADVARNASFPEDEVALRKRNRVEELKAERAQSNVVADEKFFEVIFGSHPYGRLLPPADAVGRITRESLAGFRDRLLVPDGAVLILLGDLPPRGKLLDAIRAAFGDWPGKGAQPLKAPPVPAAKHSLVLVDRPGSVQADVRVGRVVPPRTSPDFFPLLVGTNVLGGGSSSRMFVKIREEKGYAYDAHAEIQQRREAGAFFAVTQVRNEAIEPAMHDLLDEMRAMGKQPSSPDQLSLAKNYLSGLYLLRLETQAGLADQLSMLKSNGLPLEYSEKYTERVQAVTPAAMETVAMRYFDPASAAIVVVGDAAKIRPALEKLGPFQLEKAKQ